MNSKSRPRMYRATISEPVFHTVVHFFVGPSQLISQYLVKSGLNSNPNPKIHDMDGFYVRFDNETNDKRTRIVWVRDVDDFYALFHEVVHLVVDICRTSEVLYSPENEEMIAYLQTHWFRRLWHHMGKWMEKEKKNGHK